MKREDQRGNVQRVKMIYLEKKNHKFYFSIIKKEKENHPFSGYCKIKDENAKICFPKQEHFFLCFNTVLKWAHKDTCCIGLTCLHSIGCRCGPNGSPFPFQGFSDPMPRTCSASLAMTLYLSTAMKTYSWPLNLKLWRVQSLEKLAFLSKNCKYLPEHASLQTAN